MWLISNGRDFSNNSMQHSNNETRWFSHIRRPSSAETHEDLLGLKVPFLLSLCYVLLLKKFPHLIYLKYSRIIHLTRNVWDQ